MRLSDFDRLQVYTPKTVPRYEKIEFATVKALDSLAVGLQLGGHMPITSGYRTADENIEAGGVPTSQHLEGKAVDIMIPEKYRRSITSLHTFFIKAIAAGFNAIGVYYPEFVAHLDIRSPKITGQPYTWGRIGGRESPYIGYSQAMQIIAEKLQTNSHLTPAMKKTGILVLTGIGIILLLVYLLKRN